MNCYREILYLLSEICLSICIIIFGYFVWDNFDQSNYNIAKYYDKVINDKTDYEINHNFN